MQEVCSRLGSGVGVRGVKVKARAKETTRIGYCFLVLFLLVSEKRVNIWGRAGSGVWPTPPALMNSFST